MKGPLHCWWMSSRPEPGPAWTQPHIPQCQLPPCGWQRRSAPQCPQDMANPLVILKKIRTNSTNVPFSDIPPPAPPPHQDHGVEVLISKNEDRGGFCPHVLPLHIPADNLVLAIAGARVHMKVLMLKDVLMLRWCLKSCLSCVRLWRLSLALANLPIWSVGEVDAAVGAIHLGNYAAANVVHHHNTTEWRFNFVYVHLFLVLHIAQWFEYLLSI